MNNPKYNYTTNDIKSDIDYKTPPEVYKKALKRFAIDHFGLDACCSDIHIPAEEYCVNGRCDGLEADWVEYTWCNPPFKEAKKWIKKAFEENQQKRICIAMLVPARTETKYFHDYILNNPYADVEFLQKGVRFLNSKGEEMGVFKNALALVYFFPIPF